MTSYSKIQSLLAFTCFWKTYIATKRIANFTLDTKGLIILSLEIFWVYYEGLKSKKKTGFL